MSPVERLEARMDVCKSRVEEADRQRALAERAGNGARAAEWKLNAYYHGGEVAALNFALAPWRPEADAVDPATAGSGFMVHPSAVSSCTASTCAARAALRGAGETT